jgi:pimeloyl-ACP methyl ester carboxylesterase
MASHMTEQRFLSGGGQINYVEAGSGARPVVILHGLTLNWQSMNDLNIALGEVARCYLCDLPGHGKSDWCEAGYRISNYADGIAPFVAEVSGRGSVVIGFSTGALVALEVAARLPELVAGVVAIEPPLILRNSEFDAMRHSDAYGLIHWANDLNGGRLTAAEAAARFTELKPGASGAEVREAMAVASRVDPRATEQMVASRAYEDFNIEQTLHGVTCPALLMVGELELGSLIRDQDVDFFSTNAPQARIARVPGGGHGILWDETAETVHAEIGGFLESL